MLLDRAMASANDSLNSKSSLQETDLLSLPIKGLVTGVLQDGDGDDGVHFFCAGGDLTCSWVTSFCVCLVGDE